MVAIALLVGFTAVITIFSFINLVTRIDDIHNHLAMIEDILGTDLEEEDV